MKPTRRIRATASGRFVLRISPGLHAALRRAATEAGLSLNDYCARKLAAPLGNLAALRGGSETVERAARLFGDRLVGVAAFGSWARGEPVKGSDVDVLVVLDRRVTLARELYRTWDEAPVSWGGRAVEPHFVHLPEPEEGVAGIWAEVALDGLVLFEQGLRLSTRLVQVRREIAAGRIVRRVAHGQPYWTGVA
jgi:predicted nucleotidyltransferase